MAAERIRERRRVVLVACGFVVLFAVVAVRAGQLTVLHGRRLARLAYRQQHRQVDFMPLRGPVVDRGGEFLALTVDVESLYADPAELRRDPEKLEPLAVALGIGTDEVQRKAAAAGAFVWLKRLATPREVAAATAVGAPGVGSVPERRRVYPRGQLAAHVVGFVGIDSQGLEGIERQYDMFVRLPTLSFEVDRDARGRQMLTGGVTVDDVPVGARIELTLDATFQAVVERELAEGLAAAEAKSGSAVVLDPHTGAVLALANLPTFDPNNIGTSDAAARRNRAVTDIYEPGSTLKAMLAAAALNDGVVAPGDEIFCEEGAYRVGNRLIHDHHKHSWLTFADVLQYSSNIGAAKVAETLGAERLHAYLRGFGFGEKTGIGLPGEVAGRVRPVRDWKAIDLATASFGHGVAVTPLQLVRAFAAIANGGLLLRPYVVQRIVAPDGAVLVERGRHVVRRVMKPETAADVIALLRGVVEGEGGTGHRARIPGVAVAGKTGTAQKVDPLTGRYSRSARVASFAGIVPADAPRFVILVVFDEPAKARYGGIVAAPVFRRIAEAMLARLGVEAERERQVQEAHG